MSVMTGAATAYFARHFPTRTEALETGAGFLLIGGIALTGCVLPVLL
jgi:hypothetical protein